MIEPVEFMDYEQLVETANGDENAGDLDDRIKVITARAELAAHGIQVRLSCDGWLSGPSGPGDQDVHGRHRKAENTGTLANRGT